MTKLIFNQNDAKHWFYTDDNTYHYPAAWEANFTWQNRDDYFDWVKQWKQQLHTMIAQIREFKAIRRNKTLDIAERCLANEHRQYLRVVCSNLLLLRRLGKIKSAKQRDALKQSA
jgi:hypothetical protein